MTLQNLPKSVIVYFVEGDLRSWLDAVHAGHHFEGWGSHSKAMSPVPYLTAAAAIGITRRDIDFFLKRLERKQAAVFEFINGFHQPGVSP